jgi:hypothetical protein
MQVQKLLERLQVLQQLHIQSQQQWQPQHLKLQQQQQQQSQRTASANCCKACRRFTTAWQR